MCSCALCRTYLWVVAGRPEYSGSSFTLPLPLSCHKFTPATPPSPRATSPRYVRPVEQSTQMNFAILQRVPFSGVQTLLCVGAKVVAVVGNVVYPPNPHPNPRRFFPLIQIRSHRPPSRRTGIYPSRDILFRRTSRLRAGGPERHAPEGASQIC